MILNGKIVFLNNFAKKFINESDFYFWYSNKIGHNVEVHRKILDILDWAKSNNLVNIGILEFIASRKWEQFQEMKSKNITGIASTNDIYTTA